MKQKIIKTSDVQNLRKELSKATYRISSNIYNSVDKLINKARPMLKLVDNKKNNKKLTTILKKITSKYEMLKNINTFKNIKTKIKTIKEYTNILNKKRIYGILRSRRNINIKLGVITQHPIINIDTTTIYTDVIKNDDVRYFNREYENIINDFHKVLYKNKDIISASIQLQYVSPTPKVEGIESTCNIKYTDMKPFNKNSNIKKTEFKIKRPTSDFVYIISGYRIVYETKRNLKLSKKTIYELKAFHPASDRKYHELTTASTTSSKMCIYETFLDVCNIKQLKYMRHTDENKKEIKTMLKNEGKEIEDSVKSGALISSLELLTKQYNNSVFIMFYVSNANDIKDVPLCIDNGVTSEIDDISMYDGKKGFLYHKGIHVAPFLYTHNQKVDKRVETKKQTTTYKMRPEYIKYDASKIDKEIEKRKINNILGFDTETYRDSEGKCHLFNITIYGMLYNKLIKESFYGSNCLEDFINYIFKISTPKDNKKTKEKTRIENILIYGFNNSRFDNLLIYDKIYERDPMTKMIFTDNSIKQIKFNNIRIFDMSLFYAGSLSSTAQAFKLDVHKGVFPYMFPNEHNLNYIGIIPDAKFFNSKEDYNICLAETNNNFDLKQYCEKYCLLDSQLVYEIAIKHLGECVGVINKRMYDCQKIGTAAGVSLNMYKHVFQEDEIKQSPEKILIHEKNAYKGGRTEVFKKKYEGIDGGLYYYDINSSYPSSMLEAMPFEYRKTMVYDDEKRIKENITKHNLYLAKSVYKGNNKSFIPNLMIRSTEGDIIATKDTDYAYHWGIELMEAIDNGCDIYIREQHFYTEKKIFDSYSTHYYNERLKVKKTNESKSMFYKLLLNSLYGKFGQKVFTKKCMVSSNQEIFDIIGKDNKLINIEFVGDDKMIIEYETTGDEFEIGKLIRLSSYITALSRSKLSEIMRDIGHEHIYYCDTDSIFTDKKPSDKFIDNNILGKWKLECEIKKALFLSPKSYYYEDVNEEICKKSKGVQAKRMQIDDYKGLINGTKKYVSQERMMFFRSFNGVSINEMTRRVQVVYNKRIFNDDNNTSEAYQNINKWSNSKCLKKQFQLCINKISKLNK